jgi:hypothetical protein
MKKKNRKKKKNKVLSAKKSEYARERERYEKIPTVRRRGWV